VSAYGRITSFHIGKQRLPAQELADQVWGTWSNVPAVDRGLLPHPYLHVSITRRQKQLRTHLSGDKATQDIPGARHMPVDSSLEERCALSVIPVFD